MSAGHGLTAPETPAEAEALLNRLMVQSKDARDALATCRKTETDAKAARNKARRRARYLPEAPKAGMVAGVRTTVAEVEDWLDDQVADLDLAYELAKTARQTAADHVAEMGRQVIAQQSILKSVNEAYRGTREPGW
jgi:hypothetical protein